MGVSDAELARARTIANGFNDLAAKLAEATEEIKQILEGDGNYQYFKAGTDKGESVDKSINLAISTSDEKLVSNISGLSSAVETFCAEQARDNERRRRERMLEGQQRIKEGQPTLPEEI